LKKAIDYEKIRAYSVACPAGVRMRDPEKGFG